jgi:hypothetical protein
VRCGNSVFVPMLLVTFVVGVVSTAASVVAAAFACLRMPVAAASVVALGAPD